MKKKFIIFLAFLFVGIGLWATPLMYDEIRYETNFSYSIGFRFTPQFVSLKTDGYQMQDYGFGPFMDYRQINSDYQSYGFGLFYQAEWRYFILGIAPLLCFQSITPNDNGDNDIINHDESHSMFGCDVQLLFRLPILRGGSVFSLFAGPEINISNSFGLHVMGGLDCGLPVTDHHVLFINFGGGLQILDSSTTTGGADWILNNRYNVGSDNTSTRGPGVKFQVSVGIRTLRIDEVYYYQGKEVERNR